MISAYLWVGLPTGTKQQTCLWIMFNDKLFRNSKSSTEKATEWTDRSRRRYISGRSKTSRWTETRVLTNSPTSTETYAPKLSGERQLDRRPFRRRLQSTPKRKTKFANVSQLRYLSAIFLCKIFWALDDRNMIVHRHAKKCQLKNVLSFKSVILSLEPWYVVQTMWALACVCLVSPSYFFVSG